MNPQYDVPAKQLQANVRLQGKTTLPADILQRLKESADHFDAKNADWAAAAKALAEEAAKKKAEERARKEAKLARSIQYPLLSNVVDHDETISLDNPKVKDWSSSVLTEVLQLCTLTRMPTYQYRHQMAKSIHSYMYPDHLILSLSS